MKKIFLILGLFLTITLFTNTSAFAAPPGHHNPGHNMHRAPAHHGAMHQPPKHHAHHPRHRGFYRPYYYGMYNPGINLIFSNGRWINPINPYHIGTTFHISI